MVDPVDQGLVVGVVPSVGSCPIGIDDSESEPPGHTELDFQPEHVEFDCPLDLQVGAPERPENTESVVSLELGSLLEHVDVGAPLDLGILRRQRMAGERSG